MPTGCIEAQRITSCHSVSASWTWTIGWPPRSTNTRYPPRHSDSSREDNNHGLSRSLAGYTGWAADVADVQWAFHQEPGEVGDPHDVQEPEDTVELELHGQGDAGV